MTEHASVGEVGGSGSRMNVPDTCFVPVGGTLVATREGRTIPPVAEFVHRQVRALIREADFPCVLGRAAIASESYRLGFYTALGGLGSTDRLAHDLDRFVAERESLRG